MNDRKREKLRRAIEYLEKSSFIISQVIDEESESLDNIPENLQESIRYLTMEETIDNLLEVDENISSIVEGIREIVG